MTGPSSEAPTPPLGYRDVSIPLTQIVTQGAVLSAALLLLPLAVYWLVHGFSNFWVEVFSPNIFLVLLVLVAGVVLHEALHAVGWKFAGGLKWSDLSFGIDRKTLSPYCHAKVPMRASAYRFGAALPGIITGVVPLIISLVQADAPLAALSAFFLSAAVGDLIVLWVIREVPGHALVLDHPKNAGCFVQNL